MAKHKYEVTSPEGAEFAGAAVGDEVTLELGDEQETALLAAGWLVKPEAAAAGKGGKA